MADEYLTLEDIIESPRNDTYLIKLKYALLTLCKIRLDKRMIELFADGYTFPEVAQILKITHNSLRCRIKRFRRKMSTELKNYFLHQDYRKGLL